MVHLISANRVTTLSNNNNNNHNGAAATTPQPIITVNNQGSLQLATQLVGSGQQRTGNTINQVNQCPTFDVGHKQDILIADGSEKELTIKVKNMPQFKVSKRITRRNLDYSNFSSWF